MGNFKIRVCVLGQVSTNCYLVYNDADKRAVIIDPADNGPYLLNQCRELGITPEAMLLTHGHFDHILAVEDIRRAFHCSVYAGKEEVALLRDPSMNLSGTFGGDQMGLEADFLVRDKEVLDLIGYQFQVFETPGHTEGSVCYWVESEKTLFSGDTLFCESLGRTDLPTGSSARIVRSIQDKLLVLPEDTAVYPGHGDQTTIGYEKIHNPAAVYGRR